MAISLPDGRSGQALALAMTLAALAVVWIGVIAPGLDWYAQRDEQQHRQHALAQRMAALVATLPALRSEAEQAAKGTQVTATLLQGASDAVAAATLQQAIDGMAAAAGVRLTSEEILPPQSGPSQSGSDLRAIAVRVTVNAPWHSFVALLLALTQAEIPMIAEDVQLRGRLANGQKPEVPVDASFTVRSYRLAAIEQK
jgi:general secretion pathway protein M